MKITIATGVYPPEIGGPSEYARELFSVLTAKGHDVKVVTYGNLKKFLTGFRHILYFFRLVMQAYNTKYIITLDTFSTGLPAVLFSKLFRKKIVIRVGGDFLWESYVNRTHQMIFMSEFYKEKRKYSLKEKIIFHLTRFVFRNSNALVFNTDWQRKIMMEPYCLDIEKTYVIENAYLPVEVVDNSQSYPKIFLSPTRDSYVKNKKRLKEAFDLIKTKHHDIILDTEIVTHQEMVGKISKSYVVLATSLSDVSPNLVSYALESSIPVIITNDTGMKDRLKGMAIFVDPLSTEDITLAIEKMLNSEIYQSLRNNIINSTYRHSWNEIAQEFLDLYKKL